MWNRIKEHLIYAFSSLAKIVVCFLVVLSVLSQNTALMCDVPLTDTCVLLVDEVDVPESPEKQKLLSYKQPGMSRSLTVQS